MSNDSGTGWRRGARGALHICVGRADEMTRMGEHVASFTKIPNPPTLRVRALSSAPTGPACLADTLRAGAIYQLMSIFYRTTSVASTGLRRELLVIHRLVDGESIAWYLAKSRIVSGDQMTPRRITHR